MQRRKVFSIFYRYFFKKIKILTEMFVFDIAQKKT